MQGSDGTAQCVVCGLPTRSVTGACLRERACRIRYSKLYRELRNPRYSLAQAQGWLCPWCHRRLPADLADTHVDHIIPRCILYTARGMEWNLQLLHGCCNTAKGDSITDKARRLAVAHGLRIPALGAVASVLDPIR